MRDHTKLRAFHLADSLALQVYAVTQSFPKSEMFGLTSQMRKAAVSAASNVVEGSARHSEADYLRFLNIAYGSAKELEYQASLAFRLGFLQQKAYEELSPACSQTAKTLNALLCSLRARNASNDRDGGIVPPPKPKAQGLKPKEEA